MAVGAGRDAWSLGSLAGTLSLVGPSASSDSSSGGYDPCPFVCDTSVESRSMGCRRLLEDFIEAVSVLRSLALTEVRPRGELR